MRYRITYLAWNTITRQWNDHFYEVEGEEAFTKVMLSYTWEVIRGQFVILRVERIA